MGSYSDIGSLTHLGVAGFNWGVGYHDAHSTRAWALLDETFLNVGRFLRFHQRYAGERIEHIVQPKWWDDVDGLDAEIIDAGECPNCGDSLSFDYCRACQIDWSEYATEGESSNRLLDVAEDEWRRMQEESA